jgi:hypothetical protein
MIFTTPFSLNYIFLTAISIKSFSFNKKIIKNLCIINKNTDKPKNLPKIALLHLVCDDFLPYFCKKCFSQDYQNIDYFICDDSKKLEKIMEIDKFANENKCNVCRRSSKHKNSYYGRAGN